MKFKDITAKLDGTPIITASIHRDDNFGVLALGTGTDDKFNLHTNNIEELEEFCEKHNIEKTEIEQPKSE